ncbi:MAG: alpha/beta fold hydrolase [Solirubrobacteraceae bacterium]
MAPALVMLHGFTHTGASWGAVIDALPAGYRPLAPDIRGHGAGSAALPVSLSAVIEDLAALAPPSFELVGYSMGGRIALHAPLAPALRGRVERLVLIGASPGIEAAGERAARASADEALAGEIEALGVAEFAQRWARTPVLADQPTAVRERAHADRLRHASTAGLAAALRGFGTGRLLSLWGRLGELALPVSLIVGERDGKFRGIAEAMAERLPDASVTVVPGAGHAVHLEAPSAVAAAIAGRVQRPDALSI